MSPRLSLAPQPRPGARPEIALSIVFGILICAVLAVRVVAALVAGA